MSSRLLVEATARPPRRGVDDVQAELDDLERQWDEADDKPHLAHLKPRITKQIEKKQRWLKLYQAVA
jgi:hypothetical protein